MDPQSLTFAEVLGRLFSARRHGVALELDRMERVLSALGRPQQRLGHIIHIGGTNGKGSTATMVAAMARAAGYRTALYTSPHLVTVRERFLLDGEPISEPEFVASYAAVMAAGGEELTFFEVLTCMAMQWFASAGVAVTVLEVGLGGRGDATNVVAATVSAVTGVALDHQAYLGPTLAHIANEKAGIFRPGRPALIGASGELAGVEELRRAATARGASSIRLVDPSRDLPPGTELALVGSYQPANAALACVIVEELARAGGPDLAAARWALGDARWCHHPGRFQVFAAAQGRPAIVLDGAHNPHGMSALVAALTQDPQMATMRPRVWVVGVSADKDVRELLRSIPPVAEHILATAAANSRALDPAELASMLPQATASPSVEAALSRAQQLAGASGVVVVVGSLFVVGEALARLTGVTPDLVAVHDPVGVRGG